MLRSPKSLRRWLSRWLALLTFAALGLVCLVVYVSLNMNLQSRQRALLEQKKEVIEHLVEEYARQGDLSQMDHKLRDFFYGRSEFSLSLTIDKATSLYGENNLYENEGHFRQVIFSMSIPEQPNLSMHGELLLDTSADHHLRAVLAWTLFACAVVGAMVVSLIGDIMVRRALSPLHDVGKQAEMLSPDRIGDRLDESGLSVELKPLVRQFNAGLQRLERAYVQMEGFNADVAHELRTPLATLIGETELALSSRRHPLDLREVLGSNLEELQRMSAIINDMLFLSQADRGAQARVSQPTQLRALVEEVLEYHEAEALDAGVRLSVMGDHLAQVDAPLFQRAISNLLSNAVRYARPDSEVKVLIDSPQPGQVLVRVQNLGDPIGAEHLPRLFHRFYRQDSSRTSEANHHGLGLAIVAAIARMHGGKPHAMSEGGVTSIGFCMAVAQA
ncbi:two-component sensor kinase [Bordetella ansorpii]|uniref:Sensor protein n=1 Tax=Bordetella ansorpii TaxID=288768 RepID=A0A157S4Z9_9BORD|nr:heavy metal sensor histidine kinase [Bordetella ansorpii]SAI65459.1 two-component sensor kinase [Bordetella ansorpii]